MNSNKGAQCAGLYTSAKPVSTLNFLAAGNHLEAIIETTRTTPLGLLLVVLSMPAAGEDAKPRGELTGVTAGVS